jgi:hypothetical protein
MERILQWYQWLYRISCLCSPAGNMLVNTQIRSTGLVFLVSIRARRQKNTKEGTKKEKRRRVRKIRGSEGPSNVERSRGWRPSVAEALAKIKPTDFLRFAEQSVLRKRDWSDSSRISLTRQVWQEPHDGPAEQNNKEKMKKIEQMCFNMIQYWNARP